MPKEDFFYGMYTSWTDGTLPPDQFEEFNFIIDKAPEDSFKVFHYSTDQVFKAAVEAGYKDVSFKPQYPDPEYASHPVVKKYLETCNPKDYMFILSLDSQV